MRGIRGALKHSQRVLIQKAYLRSSERKWLSFRQACHEPLLAQESRLRDILARNSDTSYGRAHDFSSIRSLREFQDRVPITDFDRLSPWVDRTARGEKRVLTATEPRVFERTSGSSAANKLIPYTPELLSEFQDAMSVWFHDLLRNCPAMSGRSGYWSISPANRLHERTEGGTPIGFEDDTEYVSGVERWGWNQLSALPTTLAREGNLERWQWRTAYGLMADRDLGFMSVWSPTFAIRILEMIRERKDELLAALPASRAREIERGIAREGELNARSIWPNLKLISCWTDGPSADFLPSLQAQFPGAEIQAKGLLATEGVVSIPFWGQVGSVLAIQSHFLEFLDIDAPEGRPLFAHELRLGGSYSPLLTTSGGFYRYHLKDIVRCLGHYGKTPLIRFEQKFDRISDLSGEKLNAHFVQRVLDEVKTELEIPPGFAMLAPALGEPSYYRLFIESEVSEDLLQRAVALIDSRLSSSHHYGYSRKMGQLGPVDYQRVHHGYSRYEDKLVSLGLRRGNIKPTCLDARTIWGEVYEPLSKF